MEYNKKLDKVCEYIAMKKKAKHNDSFIVIGNAEDPLSEEILPGFKKQPYGSKGGKVYTFQIKFGTAEEIEQVYNDLPNIYSRSKVIVQTKPTLTRGGDSAVWSKEDLTMHLNEDEKNQYEGNQESDNELEQTDTSKEPEKQKLESKPVDPLMNILSTDGFAAVQDYEGFSDKTYFIAATHSENKQQKHEEATITQELEDIVINIFACTPPAGNRQDPNNFNARKYSLREEGYVAKGYTNKYGELEPWT